jgi:hypothetical protein
LLFKSGLHHDIVLCLRTGFNKSHFREDDKYESVQDLQKQLVLAQLGFKMLMVELKVAQSALSKDTEIKVSKMGKIARTRALKRIFALTRL